MKTVFSKSDFPKAPGEDFDVIKNYEIQINIKEPLKNDGMQGNEELPTEPYVAIRRRGSDEIDETVRVFQRFLNDIL